MVNIQNSTLTFNCAWVVGFYMKILKITLIRNIEKLYYIFRKKILYKNKVCFLSGTDIFQVTFPTRVGQGGAPYNIQKWHRMPLAN